MTSQVTYTMVMNVNMSWEALKLTPDYEKVAGHLIFTRLFELEPQARQLFGFGPNEDIKTNFKFDIHATAIVDMIDCAVAFLGPDLDPLEEQLITLGKRHVKYGVKPQYLSVMGQSVLFALQQILGSKFTLDDTRDWTTVFQLMSSKMALGMKVL